MKKSVHLRMMLLLLLFSGMAFAAGGAGTGTLFQPLWNILNTILGDTYLGYIFAVFSIIAAIGVWVREGGNWTKILSFVILAGFLTTLTTLAQTLAGATF